MATVPSWAGQPCKPKTATIPIFGKLVSFEWHAANAMNRAVFNACTRPKAKDRAKKIYSVGTCNCRKTTGGHSWSCHAWCGAVDLDPAQNPFTSGKLITNFPPEFVACFKEQGFGWGGDWNSVKDAMHFSIATNEGGNVKPETYDPKLSEKAAAAWKALTGGTTPVPPPPTAPGTPAPKWNPSWAPFELDRPAMHSTQIKTWQARMAKRGWTIAADGYYGQQSYTVCMAFQREKNLTVDGIVGPKTWKASWESPVT